MVYDSLKFGGFRTQLETSCVSNHTEELWSNKTISMWMIIYTLPSQELSTLVKKLTAATHIMQSSSNELSPPVYDSAKCEQAKANV